MVRRGRCCSSTVSEALRDAAAGVETPLYSVPFINVTHGAFGSRRVGVGQTAVNFVINASMSSSSHYSS